MDFLVCRKACSGIQRMMQFDIPLIDIEDRTEAENISKIFIFIIDVRLQA